MTRRSDFAPISAKHARFLAAIGHEARDGAALLGDDDLDATVDDLVHQLEAFGLELR